MAEVKAPAAAPAKPRAPQKAIKPKMLEDKVHVWPYLTRIEFLALLITMIVMLVWSITLNAPLEEPANPTQTPNPSKAPWYFLGLQEMLVYFDPWMAGVVLPSLIIVGLMVIPYIDVNPLGNGYYTFRERRFAITMFLLGFLVLWVSLIILGTFMRGPGWNLFWPWEKWDPHKVVALNNVDLPLWDVYGTGLPFKWLCNVWVCNPKVGNLPVIGRIGTAIGMPSLNQVELIGGGLITAYYALAVVFWRLRRKTSETLQRLGPARYAIVAFLFLTMVALPIKIVLRVVPPFVGLFPIKYVWVTPWFNI
jgi:hypothetical protein